MVHGISAIMEKTFLRIAPGRSRPAGSKVCVLVSGGLDSCVLLSLMAQQFRETFPVYFKCGFRWEKAETYWLRKYLKALSQRPLRVRNRTLTIQRPVIYPLTVLSLPVRDVYGSHWSLPELHQKGERPKRMNVRVDQVPDRDSRDEQVYLPGRNLLLLSKTAVFCAREGIHIIAMGQLRGNPFPDATPRFFRSTEKALSSALNCQFRVLTPFLTLSKGEVIQMGKHLDLPLNLSFSCLAPIRDHRPCRKCNKCAEWERAMAY
jgi:7-cyano-7-deazaguanine synthase